MMRSDSSIYTRRCIYQRHPSRSVGCRYLARTLSPSRVTPFDAVQSRTAGRRASHDEVDATNNPVKHCRSARGILVTLAVQERQDRYRMLPSDLAVYPKIRATRLAL